MGLLEISLCRKCGHVFINLTKLHSSGSEIIILISSTKECKMGRFLVISKGCSVVLKIEQDAVILIFWLTCNIYYMLIGVGWF
jgi:hypothetical protein